MGRKTYNTIVLAVWLTVIVLVALSWRSLASTFDRLIPVYGSRALPVVLIAVAALGFYIQRNLVDRFAPDLPTRHRALTQAERKLEARRQAAAAVKQGRKEHAIEIYEAAGLFNEALLLAEDLKDKMSQARISVRLGKLGVARRLYCDIMEYELAGHTSVLMGEMDAARGHYKQAIELAEKTAGQNPRWRLTEAQEAGLWERIGDRVAAAALYEKAGELERAAECYKLLRDKKSAARCESEAAALRALEQKGQGLSAKARERLEAERKRKAEKRAKELEQIGDLFGAAMLYRDVGILLEAGMAFERIEEWQRTVWTYEKAGLTDRAELARMHLPPMEEEPEESEIEGAVKLSFALPPPETLAALAKSFEPIRRAIAVPVHVGTAALPPASPELRLEICRRVRRGNFLEAAEFAKAAGDWVMAAAYYERSGNLVGAADIYRQVGDHNAAVFCLLRAGRPRDAALMTIALGQKDRTVSILLDAIRDAIGSGKDAVESVSTLADFLMEWGKHRQTVELLENALPPEELDTPAASLYYRLACLLEERERFREAFTLCVHLVGVGVQNEELVERHARLEQLLAESPEAQPVQPSSDSPDFGELSRAAESSEPQAVAPPEAEPPAEDEIDKMLAQAFKDFVQRRATRTPVPGRPGAGEPRTGTLVLAAAPVVLAGGPGTVLMPRSQISLFGRAAGEAIPSYNLELSEAKLKEVMAQEAEESDPFKPRQRYEIKSELGRGGMGVVYESVDTILGRRVALKMILKAAPTASAYEQFLVEARAVALLSHANVVIIYDVGMMDLRHYIAMEFVSGGSLSGLIKSEKTLPLKETLRIFIEIARGLQAAHEAGIVHRDIKPENVLLTEKRLVKITDFGLAQIKETLEGEQREKTRQVAGSPGFMAPEQIRGEELHPRADIYALGVTLFTMLVGKRPFEVVGLTSLMEIINFQTSGELIAIRRFRPDVPETIEQLYRHCASANPNERYQAIASFLPAIERLHVNL